MSIVANNSIDENFEEDTVWVQLFQLLEQQRKNWDNQESIHFLLWKIEDCLI